jgi:glycosyltransferase involved in cell wall biosynthesis
MRIALVAPIFQPVPPARHGGAERTLALLSDALVRRGHDVTLFASGDSQVSVPLVAPIARALRSDEPPSDPTAATLAHLSEVYASASAFDIIHNHAGPLAFPFARHSTTPTVTTTYDRLDRVEVRSAFEAFPEQPLVATSWDQRQALPSSDWRATIHGAVDLRRFSFRSEPGDYLVYVGRIGPEKRLDWAIDLAREAGRRLVIAGWVAPEDQAYFDHVLAPRIRRGPHVEDLAEIDDWEKDALLGGAYAFLYPAADPGASGLPLLEAMATGTPVVALEASPADELVRDGMTGFVCHSLGDMLAALDEVGELDRKASRTHVARRFSPAAMARAYEQVYARLVDASPGGGQPGVRRPSELGAPLVLAEPDSLTLAGAAAPANGTLSAPPGWSERSMADGPW